jgi:GDPmannose 4,6-dehydratase
MRKALITGINGQDGSYLSEHLLSLGYEVHGILRRHSVAEDQNSRIQHLDDRITTHYGDLLDYPSLHRIILDVQPDEIYNLGAMSHVRISFDMPSFTIQTNALGVLNMLEVYKNTCPDARFYQASSSEMFGNTVDEDGVQRLTTQMNPVSPYGCAKLLGFNLVRHYRNAYGLHACNGILFNHESPRRGTNFVTNKVIKTAILIKRWTPIVTGGTQKIM